MLTSKAGSNQFNTEFRAAFCSSITVQLCIVYIQRLGKEKEKKKKPYSSRSSLNKSGNLLFLGGTFRLLVLAAGVGTEGVRGGRAGNGAEPTLWSDHRPGSQELPITTLALHAGMPSARHPLVPPVECDPSSYSSPSFSEDC